ncbi:MAG: hypothetical protein AAGC92_11150 [Pseudomonadota bacterium]
MSIAPLKKVTLAGPIALKTEALTALQALGSLHLIPLRPPPEEPERAARREAEDALTALRFLTSMPAPRRQIRRDPAFDVAAFVTQVLDLRQRIRDAEDRREFLIHRIAAVRPWGEIAFPDEAALGGQRLWFYCLPIKHRAALEAADLPPWTRIKTVDGHDFVVLIAADEPDAETLPVPRVHMGALPLSALDAQLEEVEIALEALQAERSEMTRSISLLRADLSAAFTEAELAYAQEQTRDDDALFALQGWVPEDRMEALMALANRMVLAVTVERPHWRETPPTLLRRPVQETAGVDLAMFYQTPHYRSWDPSIVILASFAIFFAMIIADAGYGAVILGGLFMFWSRMAGSERARSWRRLGVVNALATILYGVLIGSYFGAAAPEGTLLAGLKIIDLNDFDSMMQLSIVIGVIHIVLANAMNAWSLRGRPSAIANLGWIAGILGGLGYWLGAGSAGLVAVGAGLALILFFSSDRPIARWTDWLWRLLDGAQQLTSIMGAFGDVLSYMRLFALGLASASLALTFNSLAVSVVEALPGLGFLLAALILIVGHVLNFALGLLSGVVHGLRLNYIEFYKWGLPEEGVAFRPFARQEVTE